MKTKCHSLCSLIIIGIISAATTQIRAQGTFSGGQQLNITFSEISGSTAYQPSGGASYFQTGWDYGTSSSVSNLLIVSFNVGATAATDGWILQMNDGSLSPVMELTDENVNPFLSGASSGSVGTFPGNPITGQYFYSQNWQLTDDQVQNLLAGNWYAEVDYGDNTYLGNLTTVSGVSGVTPVPEPATFTLLGLGLAAIFVRRKK